MKKKCQGNFSGKRELSGNVSNKRSVSKVCLDGWEVAWYIPDYILMVEGVSGWITITQHNSQLVNIGLGDSIQHKITVNGLQFLKWFSTRSDTVKLFYQSSILMSSFFIFQFSILDIQLLDHASPALLLVTKVLMRNNLYDYTQWLLFSLKDFNDTLTMLSHKFLMKGPNHPP